MCGFSGFITTKSIDNSYLDEMSKRLIHRGPDDNGTHIDKSYNFYAAHNRLSIIDLNKTGSQPMISSKGNVLIYNGEIYNFKAIREYLQRNYSIKFIGYSDTEVLLNLLEIEGVENSIKKIHGMFSFCYLDKISNKIYFLRDRMGEKPLYYGYNNDNFFFTSELKALFGNKEFKPKISKKSFNFITTLNYIPAPFSVYDNIYKLQPSHYITYDLNLKFNQNINQCKYWHNKIKINKNYSFEQHKNKLKKKLLEVIEDQLVADVDLGIFLSSGIDSALVATLASKISKKKINTFSMGFKQSYFDESKDSQKIADYIGSNHRTIFLNEHDYKSSIEKVNKVYCEPFSDSSQIVTIPLCNFASQFVKVCLSGDGGDELFCGYNRYIQSNKMEKYFLNKLNIIDKTLLKIITKLNNQNFNKLLMKIDKYLPKSVRIDNLIFKLKKMKESRESSKDYFEFYLKNLSHNSDIITDNINDFIFMKKNFLINENLADTLMLFDQINYLSDDIIVKMERASMANSLEVRSPFLHTEIVEIANSIPLKYKTNFNDGKIITKSILSDMLPANYISTKKKGFLVPLESLLKGPLRNWSERILFSERVSEHSFYDVDKIKNEWNRFQNNEIINFYKFWDIIIFQSWYEEYF